MNISRFKELRNNKNLTQKDIAKILEMSPVVYNRYETGLRLIPINKLILLADYYNVSIDYLLGRTDDIKPYPKSK